MCLIEGSGHVSGQGVLIGDTFRALGANALMSETQTFFCFVVSFETPDRAYQAYQEVKDHCYEVGSIDMFDAAVAGRQADGRFKILRAPARPDRDRLFTGGQWGLAPGLVIALFPAAGVGTPLHTGAARALTVLDVLAGAVSDGMTRSELEDLGTELDSGGAALVVATTAGWADELKPLIEDYGHAVSAVTEIDVEALESDLHQAEHEQRLNAET